MSRRRQAGTVGRALLLLSLVPATLEAQTPDSGRAGASASTPAQTPDSGRAGPSAPTATHAPTYPLAPTAVVEMRAFSPRIALSGYLSALATYHDDSTAAVINRARLTGMLGPLPYIGVRLQAQFSSATVGRKRADSPPPAFAVTDAYVQISPPVAALRPGTLADRLRPALLVGQFKAPFSLDYLTPVTLLKTVDRAQAVDQLALKRDIGVSGQIRWSHFGALAVAAMNGSGANTISNPANELLAVSRLTVSPLPFLAASAKIADRGADHAWGYDGRFLWRALTVEGETVFRRRSTSATARLEAGGGYALVAWRVRPWLEPVYKYDRYWDTRFTTSGTNATGEATNRTWNVVGMNVVSVPEWLRLQLEWRHRHERPTPAGNELRAQLIAAF